MSVLVQSLPHLLRGALSTLALAAAVLAVGTALGLAVGLLRVLPGRAGTVVGGAVELVRAVPLLLLFEAARSLGLGWASTMRFVILPQATRRMLPPFVGLCTILVKDTSLAAIIGVFELTRAAQETIERTLRSFEIYGAAAAIYFALCFPLTRLAARLETRLGRP